MSYPVFQNRAGQKRKQKKEKPFQKVSPLKFKIPVTVGTRHALSEQTGKNIKFCLNHDFHDYKIKKNQENQVIMKIKVQTIFLKKICQIFEIWQI